jgi:hypothetical protein
MNEHWLRVLVNEKQELIDSKMNRAFSWHKEQVYWLSPLSNDSYAEYYDETFLGLLGVKDLHIPLREFWPAGGPRYDALAKTSGDKIILLEAKAYIEELADGGTKAGQGPVARPSLSRSGGLIKTCVQKTGCVTVSDVRKHTPFLLVKGFPPKAGKVRRIPA